MLRGTPGADVICGRGGRDLLLGGGGPDRLIGGDGRDVAVGGPGDDEILGGNGNDRLHGGPGDDAIDGGSGRDLLLGGPGDDRLTGGTGRDRCHGNGGANRYDGCERGDRPSAVQPDSPQAATDADGDWLPYIAEVKAGTNPDEADTDGDGLNDRFELDLGGSAHHPLRPDTDGDGLPDRDEDADGDGLTAVEEQRLELLPNNPDSDGDTLGDGEEGPKHATNPTLFDTDDDGIDDGNEVRAGSDATAAQDHTESITGPRGTTVSITGKADFTRNLTITEVTGQPRYDNGLGRVTAPVDITLDDKAEAKVTSATVTLSYDEAALQGGQESDLRVFVFDEELQAWVPAAEQQSVHPDTNTVEAAVPHFSKYAIFNIANWRAQLLAFGGLCRPRGTGPAPVVHVDVALVIDSSGSMTSNDPDGLRVTASKSFVDALLADDRAAVVDFDSGSAVLQALTSDKAALKAALDLIDSDGGTDIGAGVSSGLTALETLDAGRARMMILLTDGDGSYAPELTTRAAGAGVTVYTIGLGSAVNETLLRDIASGTGGQYFPVASAADLPSVFRNIEQDTSDPGVDSDQDGLTDCEETNALVNINGQRYTSDPGRADTDGDGLSDSQEAGQRRLLGPTFPNVLTFEMLSDPRSADTDGDGVNDSDERKLLNQANPNCRFTADPSMTDYLTGRECTPEGFPYKPQYRSSKPGVRMFDPFGSCSTPFGLVGDTGRSFDFSDPCDTHDYGYDLLRHLKKSGNARVETDNLFGDDLLADCADRGFFTKDSCLRWALLYAEAVKLNSWRENQATPTGGIDTG